MNSTSPILTVTKPSSRTFLTVTTIIFALVGLLAVPGSFISLFVFDAPGWEKNPFPFGVVVCMFSLPVICPLSIIGAWVLYAR